MKRMVRIRDRGTFRPLYLLRKFERRLDDLHLRKIDLSEYIFVINPGGYIGASTRAEIDYATATGKLVGYLEDD